MEIYLVQQQWLRHLEGMEDKKIRNINDFRIRLSLIEMRESSSEMSLKLFMAN